MFVRLILVVLSMALITPRAAAAAETPRATSYLFSTGELNHLWTGYTSFLSSEPEWPIDNAASATYLGPSGARISITVLVAQADARTTKALWAIATEWVDYYAALTYPADQRRFMDDGIRDRPLCSQSKRHSGYDVFVGEPIGITACLVNQSVLILTLVQGEFEEFSGTPASELVTARSIARHSGFLH